MFKKVLVPIDLNNPAIAEQALKLALSDVLLRSSFIPSVAKGGLVKLFVERL
tara:strand:+ start:15666 stop:15821 length:156 start_codon:yes stop_codon:yes gene_type:complete